MILEFCTKTRGVNEGKMNLCAEKDRNILTSDINSMKITHERDNHKKNPI